MPWMTNLFNNLAPFRTRPLSQITLPGTHDSGCYVDRMTNLLSRTQTQDIAGQLAGGIRYFDIRPRRASDGRFWTYHGPAYWGGPLDGEGGILQQVAGFMAELAPTDRELAILNVAHFKSFSAEDHVALIEQIVATLGDHLLPHTQAQINLFGAPLVELLTAADEQVASRVAVLYDGALDEDIEAYVRDNELPAGFFKVSPKYQPDANRIFLFDQYADRRHVEDGLVYSGIRSDQLAKLRTRQNYAFSKKAWAAEAGNWTANAVGGVADTLHLFSWTLTPQKALGDPLEAAQTEANPALEGVFTSNIWGEPGRAYDPTLHPKINIVYVDDYGSERHRHPGCPLDGMALPVAIAARLNVYADDLPFSPWRW